MTVNNGGIIDLIRVHHHTLEQKLETSWDEKHDIPISKSEWNVLIVIYNQQPPIAQVTRSIGISRQAIHKLIKNLTVKGLVETHKMEGNKKEKYIILTPLGEECYLAYMHLKNEVENQISRGLGKDQLNMLREILQLDWGI